MIHGVLVVPLRQFPDERGKVMHMLRADDPHFRGFGEIRFAVVYPGRVRGWDLHRATTLSYAVVRGTVRMALYDDRTGSPSRGEVAEVFAGDGNYVLVQVPPGVWHGFQGIGTEPAVVAGFATLPLDPREAVHVDPRQSPIPYDWGRGLG
jgi:dTDP-4-dehydrorhamnose 3,5-epimerase